MAKSVSTDVLDAALAVVRGATRMIALSAQPTTYADTTGVLRLAETAMAPADFLAPYTGAVDGRRTTVGVKSGVNVAAAGNATHVALTDATRLLYVTTCPAQALVVGGVVNFGAWDVEIGNPA